MEAQKTLIAAQAQRDRLGDLQRDVVFKLEELNARERAAAQARLQSKLTFADIAVLDKATPPIDPAFPKPLMVIPVAIGPAWRSASSSRLLPRRPIDASALPTTLAPRHRRPCGESSRLRGSAGGLSLAVVAADSCPPANLLGRKHSFLIKRHKW